MEPKDFGRMILRRRKTVITATLVVMMTAFLGSMRKTPEYDASCQVKYIATAYDPTEDHPTVFNNTGNANDFVQLLQSPLMAARVSKALKIPAGEIGGKILAQQTPNTTNTFDLTVADRQPTHGEKDYARFVARPGLRAQLICNEYANQFIQFQLEDARSFYRQLLNDKIAEAASLQAQIDGYQAKIDAGHAKYSDTVQRDSLLQSLSGLTQKIAGIQNVIRSGITGGGQIIKPAGLGVPKGANHKRDLIFGLMVGLMFGVGIALVREYLDDTVRDKDSAQRELGIPVLAALPTEVEIDGFGEPSGGTIEAARTLRATLASMGFPHEKSMLVITSSLAKSRSTTLAALAAAVAESGRSVLVLGTDLRGGRTHEAFGVANTVGLANVVRGHLPMEKAIRPAPGMDGVYVLPCGPVIGSPGELLSSEEMAMTLRRARRWADVVLLDAPPVLAAADSSILGAYADGVVLVVSAGQTNRAQANEAKEQLVAAGARVLGAVLVGTEETTARSDGYDDFGSMPYGGWGGDSSYDADGYVDYYGESDALTMTARTVRRPGQRSSAPKKISASRPGQRPRSSAKKEAVPRNARTTAGRRRTVSAAPRSGSTARSTAPRKAAGARTASSASKATRKSTSAARVSRARGTAAGSGSARTVRASVGSTRLR